MGQDLRNAIPLAERIEITTDRGESKVVSIEGAKVWLGSGEGVAIRLRAPGLAARHLCFVKTEHGYRVEPAEPGATVEVNGEELFCKDLEVGDRIRVAGLQVRWMSSPPPARNPGPGAVRARPQAHPKPSAPSRPQVAPAREPEADPDPDPDRTPRAARALRARRRSSPLPMILLFISALVFLVVVFKTGAGSTWPQSPQHYVVLAGQQVQNGKLDLALRSLDFALLDATGTTREEALQLRDQIHALQVDQVERPKIDAARPSYEFLGSFTEAYLGKEAPVLAVRELVRRCDRWLQLYGKVCETAAAGQPMLREVQALRSRYVALANPAQPEGLEDLRFSIQVMMRLVTRDYLGAMQRFDEFQRAHPEVAGVAAEREQWLAEGETWLAAKLATIDEAIGASSSGDGYRADRMLRPLEQWCALPQWRARLQERRDRIDALLK